MKKSNNNYRKDFDPPAAIDRWGWRFHHIGIPTTRQMPNEKYIKGLKMFVTGFDTSPYGIEWMRFEKDSPISEIVKNVPHIAFEVDDLEKSLEGKNILTGAHTISEGIKVAMILDNDAPVELLEFSNRK
ncbi:MAG: hypothetical protein PVF17_08340 [Ignavibacteria bacterium]|jgi:hypothetical protein